MDGSLLIASSFSEPSSVFDLLADDELRCSGALLDPYHLEITTQAFGICFLLSLPVILLLLLLPTSSDESSPLSVAQAIMNRVFQGIMSSRFIFFQETHVCFVLCSIWFCF